VFIVSFVDPDDKAGPDRIGAYATLEQAIIIARHSGAIGEPERHNHGAYKYAADHGDACHIWVEPI
jgi:hypothetical protein